MQTAIVLIACKDDSLGDGMHGTPSASCTRRAARPQGGVLEPFLALRIVRVMIMIDYVMPPGSPGNGLRIPQFHNCGLTAKRYKTHLVLRTQQWARAWTSDHAEVRDWSSPRRAWAACPLPKARPCCSHTAMRAVHSRCYTGLATPSGPVAASPYGPTVLLNPKPLCSYEAG